MQRMESPLWQNRMAPKETNPTPGLPHPELARFHPPVRKWFETAFAVPTRAQRLGWPAIARGDSTLILAPTGSGKTLAAFLWCLNRLMFRAAPRDEERCRVVYISPVKALAVDAERNLQAPLAGIAQAARRMRIFPGQRAAHAIRTRAGEQAGRTCPALAGTPFRNADWRD